MCCRYSLSGSAPRRDGSFPRAASLSPTAKRSEEHTSELQSRFDLVCRLLLEKKKLARRYLPRSLLARSCWHPSLVFRTSLRPVLILCLSPISPPSCAASRIPICAISSPLTLR